MIIIIVPVYNVVKIINRCIDSILAQTFTDFELILVDDGSPDNSGRICDEYAKKDIRIHVIHKENGGLSDARNAGIDWAIKKCSGEWITFIDSDDWVHPEFLERMFQAAIESSAEVSMCRFTECEEYNIELDEIKDPVIVKPEEIYFGKEKGIIAYACGKLYKKSLFIDVRFDIGKLFEDLFLTYKILFKLDSIALIDSGLYFYYKNSESIVRGSWTFQKLDQIEAFEKRLLPFFRQYSKKYYERIKTEYIELLFSQFLWAKDSNQTEGMSYIRKKIIKSTIKYNGLRRYPIKSHLWNYENVFPFLIKWYCALKSKAKH